ncbi:hypothetical protein JW872_00090 [Candidatus Babeliales bacterium]|nr:hypothetical protein [Candidatus Babeliales bacterium]
MKCFSRIIIAALSFVVLAHFSSDNSTTGGKEKHSVNFYGTLTDNQGNVCDVDNISISGLYKQIPVYQKPEKHDINPDINKSRIDLAEVYAIKMPGTEPIITKFDKREYVDIIIVSNDKNKTEYRYIIELSRKIYCDQLNDAGPIEKEISFQALNNLVIKGYKHRDPDKTCECKD